MKKEISITEYAKLRGVTTETLRYYDRIGLITPSRIDENSGMRYYSLKISEERLGTVMELKQLGLSLNEIKEFFLDRNARKSIEILKERQKALEKHILNLRSLQSTLEKRLDSLERLVGMEFGQEVFLKDKEARQAVYRSISASCEEELNYDAILLEKAIREKAPIIGGGRFLIEFTEKEAAEDRLPGGIGIFFDEKGEGDFLEEQIKTIPEGRYACKYVAGDPLNLSEGMEELRGFCEENGYQPEGNYIKILMIDMSVTNLPEENICELQVRVKKK